MIVTGVSTRWDLASEITFPITILFWGSVKPFLFNSIVIITHTQQEILTLDPFFIQGFVHFSDQVLIRNKNHLLLHGLIIHVP